MKRHDYIHKKGIDIMIFKCVGCDKTTEYDSGTVGSYNIGHAMKETGWYYGRCTYLQEEMWLCNDCYKKALDLMDQLLKIVKTPFYEFGRLIPFETRAKFKGI
jgi:hypothetical protein